MGCTKGANQEWEEMGLLLSLKLHTQVSTWATRAACPYLHGALPWRSLVSGLEKMTQEVRCFSANDLVDCLHDVRSSKGSNKVKNRPPRAACRSWQGLM